MMEYIPEPNFIEDFEHESRRIEYQIDPDRPGFSGRAEDAHESLSSFDETLQLALPTVDTTNRSS